MRNVSSLTRPCSLDQLLNLLGRQILALPQLSIGGREPELTGFRYVALQGEACADIDDSSIPRLALTGNPSGREGARARDGISSSLRGVSRARGGEAGLDYIGLVERPFGAVE